jgi:hypothetical protein
MRSLPLPAKSQKALANPPMKDKQLNNQRELLCLKTKSPKQEVSPKPTDQAGMKIRKAPKLRRISTTQKLRIRWQGELGCAERKPFNAAAAGTTATEPSTTQLSPRLFTPERRRRFALLVGRRPDWLEASDNWFRSRPR